MRLHVIQQVPFEGPALIADWAQSRRHELTSALALTEEYPPAESVDFLVVLGGPMDADDEVASPWLHAEKHFVAECIALGHPVLGVCLGAQIIAEVLGGKVKRNPVKEIGWFTVERTEFADEEPLIAEWPPTAVVGQWHGDTFDLPLGLKPLYTSEACVNQAFVFDRRVVGLQFHLEWSERLLTTFLEIEGANLDTTDEMWIMSASEIADEAPERIADNRKMLFALLDAIAREGQAPDEVEQP